MTHLEELLPPMKWNAWGDPAAAKPLSDGILSLLKQAVGLEESEETELEPDQVQLRPSSLSQADRDALAAIVGAEYVRMADRDRLLRAGGKSTPDLLRRKDTGVQDAPDAVLLPGGPDGDDEVAATLRYCAEHGIACMMGGMLESRVALTAFAHFALAHDNIIFYDMDTCMLGHTADPVTGGVRYKGYFLEIPETPGLGADGDEAFLQHCEKVTV